MFLTKYYLFKPKKDFLENVMNFNSDLLVVMGQPMLFSRGEGDKTMLNNDEYIETSKITFLTFLKLEYLREDYDSIFKTNEISEEVFDNWWTVEKYDLESDLDQIASKVKLIPRQCFSNLSNENVENWIEKHFD